MYSPTDSLCGRTLLFHRLRTSLRNQPQLFGTRTRSQPFGYFLPFTGIRVLAATHVLSGAERGISRKHGGVGPVELMADTLRMLGQGVKVCVEIAVMALDAGLIPHGEEIMAVAGSGRGADTAVIMHPAHANNILDTKINEIVCKPKNF